MSGQYVYPAPNANACESVVERDDGSDMFGLSVGVDLSSGSGIDQCSDAGVSATAFSVVRRGRLQFRPDRRLVLCCSSRLECAVFHASQHISEIRGELNCVDDSRIEDPITQIPS